MLKKDFKKIRNKKTFKLQTKLFIIYIAFSVIIIFFIALFCYKYVSQILIQNELDSLNTLNTSFKEQVDSAVEELDTVSANISYSNLVLNKLESSFNLNIDNNSLNELADLFVSINGTEFKSDQINLYDMNGNVVRVGMVTNTIEVDINNLSWLEEVIDLNGHKHISDPYNTSSYSTLNNSEWYISLYRVYKNNYGKTVGAIETIKRCKNIFKSVISYRKRKEDGASIYIYGKDGSLIYPYDITLNSKETVPNYYLITKNLKSKNEYYNSYTDKIEYLVHDKSNYSDWTYLSVQQASIVLSPVNTLLLWISLIAGIILIVAIFVSYFLSQNMVKPINQLKKIIKAQEISTLGQKSDSEYYPSYAELGELYNDYHNMSEKLHQSMTELIDSKQQESKASILALQSQTNPHFYYNTLSNIIVLSEKNKNKEVIQLCHNLTQIMRYVTNNSVTRVTIKEEIEYVEKYLYCMKIRYQESLNVNIDIDISILDILIPKLSVQTLVENAIKYGTDCIPPWKIDIIGKSTNSSWYITITDTGNGFSKKKLFEIKERIDKFNINPGFQELKIDGLGLMNVYIRLKYQFNKNLIFDYGNTNDGHGFVKIGCILKEKPNEL